MLAGTIVAATGVVWICVIGAVVPRTCEATVRQANPAPMIAATAIHFDSVVLWRG
jgi:hypothetical protein